MVAKVFCLDEEHGESDDSEAPDSGWEDDDDDSGTFLTKSLFLRRQRISMFRLVDTTIFLHISLQLNDVVGLNGVCHR